MNFKVGQKVVCVDDSVGRICGKKLLIKDEIYEVMDIKYRFGLCGLEIFPDSYWDSRRFRPVDEQFGENVCKEIEESFLKEELVCR